MSRITLDDLLPRLSGVRKSGAGFVALCSGHDDRSPSLSIREGNRGVLLKCWSGCTLDEICSSLGIEVQDLFTDALDRDPRVRRKTAQRREAEAILSYLRPAAEWELIVLEAERSEVAA